MSTASTTRRTKFFIRGASPTVAAIAILFLAAGNAGARAASIETPSDHRAITGKVTNAIESPLHDVNLVKTEIPSVLQEARRAPYAPVVAADCEMLGSEIGRLDSALGRDLDSTAPKESTRDKAIDKAIGAGAGAASSFIPYRGVVRFVTGAEKHDKTVAESVLAGSIRRAYLKGIGESLGCSYPGAPLRTVATEQD